MVHHWRASDGLEPTAVPGRWALFDRGTAIGYIEYGRVGGKDSFRGILESGQVVGHSATLEECCTDFWNWYIRYVKAGG